MRFGESGVVGSDSSPYLLNGHRLLFVESYRDLGIIVDKKLKFHSHVLNTVQKCIGLSNQLLRSTICRSAQFMISMFVSNIRPILEYGSPVWNVGYLGDNRMLERVQRRWTKQVQGLSLMDYESRLRQLRLYSVYGRFLRADIIKVGKTYHSERKNQDLKNLFIRSQNLTTRGHSYKLLMPRCRTELSKRSLTARVVNIWNALPAHWVETTCIENFKSKLEEFLGRELYKVV